MSPVHCGVAVRHRSAFKATIGPFWHEYSPYVSYGRHSASTLVALSDHDHIRSVGNLDEIERRLLPAS